jgi:hypothetical protein
MTCNRQCRKLHRAACYADKRPKPEKFQVTYAVIDGQVAPYHHPVPMRTEIPRLGC